MRASRALDSHVSIPSLGIGIIVLRRRHDTPKGDLGPLQVPYYSHLRLARLLIKADTQRQTYTHEHTNGHTETHAQISTHIPTNSLTDTHTHTQTHTCTHTHIGHFKEIHPTCRKGTRMHNKTCQKGINKHPKCPPNTLREERHTPSPLRSSTRPLFSSSASHGGAHKHPKMMFQGSLKSIRNVVLWQVPTNINCLLDLNPPRMDLGIQFRVTFHFAFTGLWSFQLILYF